LGIEFSRTTSSGVARRAAAYDYIVLYGDRFLLADRLEAYRFLGVDARLIHVTVSDAPSIPELMGHVGLVARLGRRGRVLVEGLGVEGFLAAALLVARRSGLARALRLVRAGGYNAVYNPLQARALVLLDVLGGWVDTLREALTRRDEAYSWEADLALEHAYMLAGFMPLSLSRVYRAALGRGGVGGDAERLAVEAGRLLAPSVRCIYIEPGMEVLSVHLGCSDPRGCRGLTGVAEKLYSRLARWLGLRGVRVLVEAPFETACLAYGYVDAEMCGREGGH